MIDSLHISNYALIDTLDLSLKPGLNIITGETGAGKSIMLGALSLLLGERADTKAVRHPDTKSVIEATFSGAGKYPKIEEICRENDIDTSPDADRVILRREISPSGRSRAFVNDTPVTLPVLQGVALQLVDIHSQHQNLLLASPPYQLQVIDSLCDFQPLKDSFANAFRNYRQALREYKEARNAVETARDQEEYLRYQYAKLKEANLQNPDEQEELEREREVMINMADIKSSLGRLMQSLTEGEPSAASLLKTASDQADSVSDLLEDADSLSERLTAARTEVIDIAETFAQYDRSLLADPQQLETTEERLNLFYDLQRRFKVATVGDLIKLRDSMAAKLGTIEQGDEQLHEKEIAARKAKKEALELARQISEKRRETGSVFAQTLKDKALPLGMKNLQVEVTVREAELSYTGIDAVEFLFAFNKNQPLLPVGNTASGGEISRLMLSIKSIVANKMQLPSIIFDEVDTGVSGDVANKMGQMMRDIAGNIQVIAITHLPQVAAKGSSHFKVFKQDTDNATVTRIKELTSEERVDELALMLSGSSVNEAARQNAQSLLAAN